MNERTLTDSTITHEGLLHLVFEWICIPSSRRYLSHLYSFLKQCDLLSLVSKRFEKVVKNQIYPKLKRCWDPYMKCYETHVDPMGYYVWPNLEPLLVQPFQKIVSSFRIFTHCLPFSQCHHQCVISTFAFTPDQVNCLPISRIWGANTFYDRLEVAEAALFLYHHYRNYSESRVPLRKRKPLV
jgi:hypothetical protein